MLRTFIFLLLLTTVAAQAADNQAANDQALTLPSGVEVVSQRFPPASPGSHPVLLWFTGQYGPVVAEQSASAQLAQKGVEVWLTDWLAPYFLPQLPGSMAQVPDRDLGDWLARLHQSFPGRPLVLAASGHAAELALRAARDARDRLGIQADGSVLLFPLLYQDVEAGEQAAYDPLVNATRLKLSVLVPMASAGYWWRDQLKAQFEAAGSQVSMTVLPGLRDGFYRRTDATGTEQAAGARLGETLWQALGELITPNPHPSEPKP